MTTTLQRITNVVHVSHVRTRTRIRVVHGLDGQEEIVELPAAGVVVGSDRACDVILRDPAASRRHVSVVPATDGFVVADLGSRNGTWIDGVKVTQATVSMGTILRVGATLLELLPAEGTMQLEPSSAISFGALLGGGDAMRRVYAVLERASPSDVPVLLLGESGTGKELAARAVHDYSPRAKAPFVVFDCGAASESLVESELFGHKRGAFTGAHSERPGAFALAHGGTLFLDEIGDLPLALQPKLLRMLERGEVTPLGARAPEHYDVRFVAATHRDVWAEAEKGTFRSDLYFRLAVVEVHLPALRKRREDIADLVRSFLRANGASDEDVGGQPLERLLAYSWPGNVRELRNVVARAVALAPKGTPFQELPLWLRTHGAAHPEEQAPLGRADVPYHQAKEALLSRFDREYMTDLLRRAEGNLSEAARIAGLERKHLYKVLERAGVQRPSEGRD